MNNKLTALLTTAVVTGMLAGNMARGEDKPAEKNGEMSANKDCCKGHDKNKCKCIKHKKMKKGAKEGCGNSCEHKAKDAAPKAETPEEKK